MAVKILSRTFGEDVIGSVEQAGLIIKALRAADVTIVFPEDIGGSIELTARSLGKVRITRVNGPGYDYKAESLVPPDRNR